MRKLLPAIALVIASGTTALAADDPVVKVKSSQPVAETMDALAAAVENAGVTIFARVDHGAGAATVDMDLADSELLVFGNPKVGTPAMQADPLAGLYLPMKVLVYQDAAGDVWLAYEDPAKMLEDLDIDADAPYVAGMTGALGKLTGAASGN